MPTDLSSLPQPLVIGALAAFLGTVLLASERLFAVERRPLLRRGLRADLIYGPVNVSLRFVVNGTIAVAFAAFSARVLPAGWTAVLRDEPLWLQALVLLLALDLVFYVTHRLKHRWTWWWRLHETHHSSVDLDFISSVRFHPLEKILDRVLYLPALIVLGPSPEAALIWACCDTGFGLFIHSNLPLRIGPLRYLFCSPEMHRWHHVKELRMQRVNFANNFALFDWLLGTAFVSKDEPRDFGVDEPDYPQENVAAQFAFAFRPREARSATSQTIEQRY